MGAFWPFAAHRLVFWGFSAVLALFPSGPVAAQTLDTFNPAVNGYVYALAVQTDGKILVGGSFTSVAGQSRNAIGRVTGDGTLDANFNPIVAGGSGGPPFVNCLAVQADGKIVVGGNFGSLGGRPFEYIGRLNPDGSGDGSFSVNRGADFYVYALAVQADGKIVVGGRFTTLGGQPRSGLGRLNADGSLDDSFNPGVSGSYATVYSLAVQPDGNILVGGDFTTLAGQTRNYIGRLNADGSLDTSFNPGANYWAECLFVQPDGRIVVGGAFTMLGGQSRNYLGRLRADGSLDSGFNPAVGGTGASVLALGMQTDGKIIVGGDFFMLGGQVVEHLGRLNSDGSLDMSFDPRFDAPFVYSLAVQPDGKTLAGGNYKVVRFNNTSLTTQSFNYDGSKLFWERGGTATEVWRTTFEVSTDALDWFDLGEGSRVDGGWQLADVALPAQGTVRARGFVAGGSSWFEEALWQIRRDFRITNISIETNGLVRLRHEADTNFYYILYRGNGITNMVSAVDVAIATNNSGELADAVPAFGNNDTFYRILQVPINQPLDLDGDGIDDVYELRHRRFLDPLNPADALRDFDQDGISNLQEYRAGLDPTVKQFLAPTVVAPVSSTKGTSIGLSGTARPNQIIRIDGGSVSVTNVADASGSFIVNVPLNINRLNRIFVSSIDADGNSSSPQPIEILQISQPPSLFIDSPADNSEVTDANVTVAGRVDDVLDESTGVAVLVNGQAADVDLSLGSGGTFVRGGVALELGTNIVTVVASDALGNRVTNQITLRRIPLTGPRLLVVSGDMQRTNIHCRLAELVVVKAAQADGVSPLANQLIDLDVTRSDGRLLPADAAALASPSSFSNAVDRTGDGVMHLALIADANGQARAWWTLGGDAGSGNNRLRGSSPGISNSIYFCASAGPAPVSQISVGSGNNQRGEVSGPSREPLRAWVSDSFNGVPNVPVMFTVTQGGGKLFSSSGAVGPRGGAASLTVNSDATGHAQVYFLLGPDAVLNMIQAGYPGNTNLPATFILYGIARDPAKRTTFTGLVLDNSSQPVGGAWVRLFYPSAEGNVPLFSTYSDTQGQFIFTNAQSGPAELNVLGSSATTLGGNTIPAGSFPGLSFSTMLIPNAENSLATPVLLPRLNPNNARLYYGTNNLVLTCDGIEGFKMTIKANSMRDPRGLPVTPDNPITVSLDPIHRDAVPVSVPDGGSPPFTFILQPGESSFDPPVQIEYPNMSSLAAGAVGYLQSYNRESDRFEIIASGRVQDDSATFLTDPGVGLGGVNTGYGARLGRIAAGTYAQGGSLAPASAPDSSVGRVVWILHVTPGAPGSVQGCIYECKNAGSLSRGQVDVLPKDVVCEGQTITFTPSGVSHTGGELLQKCPTGNSTIPIAGTPKYSWVIESTALVSPLQGTGIFAGVPNAKAGKYTCRFTARIDGGPGLTCVPAPMPLEPKDAYAIKVEFQINNTPDPADDVVRVKCDNVVGSISRWPVHCQARVLGGPPRDVTVNLINPDGRLRFPDPGDTTRTLTLPKDGTFVAFDISGQSPSIAVGDAKIQAQEFVSMNVCGEVGVTVFTFESGAMDLVPTGATYDNCDRVVEGKNIRFIEPSSKPVIRLVASSRIHPSGLDCNVDQIKKLSNGIVQNVIFTDIRVFDSPSITWFQGTPTNTTVNVPSVITFTIQSPVLNDSLPANDPLYSRGITALQPPFGCAGAANASANDSPDDFSPLIFECPATVDSTQVGTVTYKLAKLTSFNTFTDWAVIFNIEDSTICPLAQNEWILNLDSTAGPGQAPSAGSSSAVSCLPITGGPFATIYGNDPNNAVRNESGPPVSFTKTQ